MRIESLVLNPLNSTKPEKWKLHFYNAFIFFTGPIFRFFLSRKFSSIEVEGKEHLEKGPFLLVMNHSCPIDPLLITFFGGKHLQFMITEVAMLGGFMSKLGHFFGQISKRKLTFDFTSIRLMKQWLDLGGRAAVFPEGVFSWDGKPNPLVNGIDGLIKFLNVPVVTVNLQNGDCVKPMWADNYRKTAIKIKINAPITFKSSDNIEEIIKDKIFGRGNQSKFVSKSTGINLSHGLSKHLRYCPTCNDDNSLKDNNNSFSCTSCKSEWLLDGNNNVVGLHNTISELFQESYRISFERFSESLEFKTLNNVSLFNVNKPKWEKLSDDILLLNKHKIIIGDVEIDIEDIEGFIIDWREIVIVKTRKNRYALQMLNDSRAIFCSLLGRVKNESSKNNT